MQDEIREKALQELKIALLSAVSELFLASYPTNPNSLTRIPPLSSSSIVNPFFRHWYSGTTFIFRKNIKVTNVMLGEMLALLQIHTTSSYEKDFSETDFAETDLGFPQKSLEQTPRNYIKSSEMKVVFGSLWDSIVPKSVTLQKKKEALQKLKKILFATYGNEFPESEPDNDWTEWYARAHSTIDFLVQFYGDYFVETLLVDTYAGSCHVFSPNALKIDNKRICHEAGYIYSTGQLIYMRRSTKVDIPTLRRKIYQWLERNDAPREVPIIVFSREQFNTSANNDVRRMETNGTDDLKFHLDKFFFGSIPVSELLRNIMLPSIHDKNRKDITKDQLDVVKERLRPWRDQHDSNRIPGKKITGDGSLQSDSKATVLENSDTTIFIQVERHIHLGEPITPHSRYFLCFAQEYLNRNQMFEIDEAKPGWTAPVTIPHTLAASMINIARGASYDKRTDLTVLDPFCGTGTFAFEASKLSKVEKFLAFDYYPLNKQAWEDNQTLITQPFDMRLGFIRNIICILSKVNFDNVETGKPKPMPQILEEFLADESKTSKLASLIADHSEQLGNLKILKKEDDLSDKVKFSWAISYIEFLSALRSQHDSIAPQITHSAYKRIANYQFSELALQIMEKSDWESRILVYLFWKSLVTNVFSIVALQDEGDYHSEMLKNAIDEIQKFVLRCDRINFIDSAKLVDVEETPRAIQNSDHAVYRKALYSTKIAVDWETANRKVCYEALSIEELKNRQDLRHKIDIIVTDPPYGYNVRKDVDLDYLPVLYQNFFDVVFTFLKNGGQVVFSVPDVPMNGQQIPFYLTKNFITKQFLVSARRHNRAVIQGARSLPSPTGHFRPPFYWESERALRRAIMNFTVHDA